MSALDKFLSDYLPAKDVWNPVKSKEDLKVPRKSRSGMTNIHENNLPHHRLNENEVDFEPVILQKGRYYNPPSKNLDVHWGFKNEPEGVGFVNAAYPARATETFLRVPDGLQLTGKQRKPRDIFGKEPAMFVLTGNQLPDKVEKEFISMDTPSQRAIRDQVYADGVPRSGIGMDLAMATQQQNSQDKQNDQLYQLMQAITQGSKNTEKMANLMQQASRVPAPPQPPAMAPPEPVPMSQFMLERESTKQAIEKKFDELLKQRPSQIMEEIVAAQKYSDQVAAQYEEKGVGSPPEFLSFKDKLDKFKAETFKEKWIDTGLERVKRKTMAEENKEAIKALAALLINKPLPESPIATPASSRRSSIAASVAEGSRRGSIGSELGFSEFERLADPELEEDPEKAVEELSRVFYNDPIDFTAWNPDTKSELSYRVVGNQVFVKSPSGGYDTKIQTGKDKNGKPIYEQLPLITREAVVRAGGSVNNLIDLIIKEGKVAEKLHLADKDDKDDEAYGSAPSHKKLSPRKIAMTEPVTIVDGVDSLLTKISNNEIIPADYKLLKAAMDDSELFSTFRGLKKMELIMMMQNKNEDLVDALNEYYTKQAKKHHESTVRTFESSTISLRRKSSSGSETGAEGAISPSESIATSMATKGSVTTELYVPKMKYYDEEKSFMNKDIITKTIEDPVEFYNSLYGADMKDIGRYVDEMPTPKNGAVNRAFIKILLNRTAKNNGERIAKGQIRGIYDKILEDYDAGKLKAGKRYIDDFTI